MDKYIALYHDGSYILTDTGMVPFESLEKIKTKIKYFQEVGHLSDAKICKLVEI